MKHIGLASLVVAISLTLAILCAGCTSSTTPSPNAGTAVGNATALGAGITVVQGQNFTIQLKSNPSTGYHWEPTYDNSTFTLTNRAFVSSVSTQSAVVGAGGTDVFTFQGTKQGTSVITIKNISPSNETANSASYTVVITS